MKISHLAVLTLTIPLGLQAAPPVTAGLQVWLSARAGTSTTVDGDPVSSWTDQQNGHVFNAANATLPTYVADSGGGKPAIDFTRSSGFLGDFSSTAGATIGDATIFVLGRFEGYTHSAGSSSYWFSIDSATAGSEHTLGRDEGSSGPDAIYHWRGQPAQAAYYGDNIVEPTDGSYVYYTAIFRSAASGGGVEARIDGVDGNLVNSAGDPASAYEADPAQTRIGLWTSNGSGLDGRIRELLIFDRVLSAGEIAQVEAYLSLIASPPPPPPEPAPPISDGLEVWLSARGGTGTTTDSATVSSWTDQANGHVFDAANAELPTYVADSGGGNPAIDFTRSSGFLGDFSSTAGATIGDATIFVLGRFEGYTHSASSSSYWFSIDSATGGSEHTLGRDEGASGPDAIYHWRGQPAQAAYYGDNIVEPTDGGYVYYTAIFRSAASGGGVEARINGVEGNLANSAGDPASAYEADPAQTRIGLWTSNGSGLDGRIRELLIFNRVLSAGEIAQVEAYLAGLAAGPTAVAPSPAPPVQGGMQVWLTARGGTSTTSDSATVSSWVDQANGHVFGSANAELPTYVADSGDGQPAIDFTRSSGFIGDFSSTAGATIDDATIFVVGRFAGYSHAAGSSSYWFSIDSATGGSEHTLGRDERSGVGADALYHWRGQPAQNAYYGDNIVEDPSGAFVLYTAIFRGAASGGGVQAFINGLDGNLANIDGDPDTGYEADPSQTRIGLWTSNGSGLDGMIRELIIFNRILNEAEIAQVQNYLAEIAGVKIVPDPEPPVSDGLQVWLTARAGSSSYVDGATVAQWTDQANGHVFNNANSTLPTFVADSGGGIPAIDFTRSSGFLGDFSSTAGATIGDATIFVIGRFAGYTHAAGSSSYWLSIDSSTGGSEHTLGRDEQSGTGPDALYHWRGQPAQNAYYGDNIVEDPNGAFTYYTAIFRGASSGGGVAASVNGADGHLVNIDGDPDSAYEADPSQTRIGLWTSNGSGLDGQIREVLIYNRILEGAEIAQVEAYLAQQAVVPVVEPLALSIQLDGGMVNLAWTGAGVLQSAPQVTGPWTNLPDVTNPVTIDPTETQEFFRMIQGLTEVPPGTVLRTSFSSDTFREVEYHLDTGDLLLIGEQAHGLDFFTAERNAFWWCFMNTTARGSGLIEYLMLNNPLAGEMKATAVSNGWRTYTTPNFSFLIFDPLPSQVTFANQTAPPSPGDNSTTRAYTDDYVAIDPVESPYLLYRNSDNQTIYLGIGGPGVTAVVGGFPPGDGSDNRDNGVRADIAFKVNIQLTQEQKLELVNLFEPVTPKFDDSATAYFYVHPPGL